jgi:hypothetical protein
MTPTDAQRSHAASNALRTPDSARERAATTAPLRGHALSTLMHV